MLFGYPFKRYDVYRCAVIQSFYRETGIFVYVKTYSVVTAYIKLHTAYVFFGDFPYARYRNRKNVDDREHGDKFQRIFRKGNFGSVDGKTQCAVGAFKYERG